MMITALTVRSFIKHLSPNERKDIREALVLDYPLDIWVDIPCGKVLKHKYGATIELSLAVADDAVLEIWGDVIYGSWAPPHEIECDDYYDDNAYDFCIGLNEFMDMINES